MPKPTSLPIWATDALADVVEPTLTKKQTGWVANERPPAQYFNWWQELVHDWCSYLDSIEGEAHAWTGSNSFTNISAATVAGTASVASGGTLAVQNGGTLDLQAGSSATIDGAVDVTSNGTIDLSDSELFTSGNGVVRVNNSGSFVAESGSTVQANAGSVIDINSNIVLGTNSDFLYGSGGTPGTRQRTQTIAGNAGAIRDGTWGVGNFGPQSSNAGRMAYDLSFLPSGGTLVDVRVNIQQDAAAANDALMVVYRVDFGVGSPTSTPIGGPVTLTTFGTWATLQATGINETINKSPFANAAYYLLVTAANGSNTEISGVAVVFDDPGPRNY